MSLPDILASAIPVAAAGMSSSLVTPQSIAGWYGALAKPAFTPPNGLFAPVWIALYVAMAYAVWRVMALPARTPGRRAALAWFFIQLALNAAWPWAFFGARSPAAGAATILALLASLLVTIHLFRQVDRVAALLLAPCAAWVGYATYLTFGVWRLN